MPQGETRHRRNTKGKERKKENEKDRMKERKSEREKSRGKRERERERENTLWDKNNVFMKEIQAVRIMERLSFATICSADYFNVAETQQL